jgi:DNA-binding transcriptional regulator YdaS (Cro superfamily)
MDETPLQKAVNHVGGKATTLAQLIGRKQSTVWDWLNKEGRKVPPDACREIERATDGKVTAEELRPDLAALFKPSRKAKRRAA